MTTLRTLLATGAALGVLTLLAGCMTATPYQAAVVENGHVTHSGYSETKVEDGRYRLSFAGNDATPRATVEDYMLYHAAELTLNDGYDWFEVVKRDTDVKKRTITTDDDPFFDGLSWRFRRHSLWGGWGPFDDFESDTFEYDRYEATAEILMHKGAKPDGNPAAYDARSVKANLEAKIVRPASR